MQTSPAPAKQVLRVWFWQRKKKLYTFNVQEWEAWLQDYSKEIDERLRRAILLRKEIESWLSPVEVWKLSWKIPKPELPEQSKRTPFVIGPAAPVPVVNTATFSSSWKRVYNQNLLATQKQAELYQAEWEARRKRANAPLPRKCAICGSPRVQWTDAYKYFCDPCWGEKTRMDYG